MPRNLLIGTLALAMMVGDDPPSKIPKPTSAEAIQPMEVRVHFEKAIPTEAEPALLKATAGRSIPYHEVRWNKDEAAPEGEPIGHLRIAAARLSEDRKTLILATDPHPRRAVYVVDLASGQGGATAHYLYSGVEVRGYPDAETMQPSQSSIGRTFQIQPGEGTAKRMELRARVQVPRGPQTLVLDGNMPFEATVAGEDARPSPTPSGRHRVEVPLEGRGEPIEIFTILETDKSGPRSEFSARWKTGETEVLIPPSQIELPWLPIERPASDLPAAPFDLAGGDAARGEALFRSESAKCASCHAMDGKGGEVGPALEIVKGRDPRDVYHSIAEPSARISPEYRTYTVARKDGQVAVGVVRAEGFDAIKVLDINGQATVIPRSEIDDMQPSDTSTMPVGLAGAIGEVGMRDLIAYLIRRP